MATRAQPRKSPPKLSPKQLTQRQLRKLTAKWQKRLQRERLPELEKVSGTGWTFGTVSGASRANLSAGPTVVSLDDTHYKRWDWNEISATARQERLTQLALERFGTANAFELSGLVDAVREAARNLPEHTPHRKLIVKWAESGLVAQDKRLLRSITQVQARGIIDLFLASTGLSDPWEVKDRAQDPTLCADTECSSYGKVHAKHGPARSLSKEEIEALYGTGQTRKA